MAPYWVIPAENFPWKRWTSDKVELFLQTKYSKLRKVFFQFFKAIFDTSFRPGWNWFVHGKRAKPWTDQFAHVNGRQPRLHKLQSYISVFVDVQFMQEP